MNLALKMFIDEKGKELLEKNLYRNFVLHVCNLFEFGVLGPGHVFTAITRMQKFLSERNHVFTDWPQQLSHWNAHGAHEHNKSASAHSNQFAGDIFEKCIGKILVFISKFSLEHSIKESNGLELCKGLQNLYVFFFFILILLIRMFLTLRGRSKYRIV